MCAMYVAGINASQFARLTHNDSYFMELWYAVRVFLSKYKLMIFEGIYVAIPPSFCT